MLVQSRRPPFAVAYVDFPKLVRQWDALMDHAEAAK